MGHAYTTVLSDIFARYHKLNGEEVYFLTGSDENTEKMVRAAKSAGRDPKEYLDEIILNFKDLFTKLDIDYSQFIRTSDEKIHWPGAQVLWKKLVESGDIEKRSYEGLYCVGHEAFITEKDLVDGECPDHNEVPQLIKEENYFFKLSKYTERIKEKIKSEELKIIPESRKNEILALLERGLEDISFSRPANKVSVGIPVPNDPSQVMYVWCDALSNYITALGYGRKEDEIFKKFWPVDVHMIGKDILRFHAAIWPAMLLSAGLPLPKKIFVHGFITSGGKKMSKSLGNTIDPLELIAKYGKDAMRYYLARHISPFEDGDLTEESFKNAYNAGLANGLGNLVSRVMTMAVNNGIKAREVDLKLFSESEWYKELSNYLEKYEINKATEAIWKQISESDLLIQIKQPFKVIKTDLKEGEIIIHTLLQYLIEISVKLRPFMPDTSLKIEKLIKENKIPEKPLFARKD
jgi:methionyl-tRNA synthetase